MMSQKSNHPIYALEPEYTIINFVLHIRTFMIFALLLVLTTENSSAESIAGFENLRWKMTKAQVESYYPNFEEWIEEKPAFFDPLNGKRFEKTQENKFGLKEYYVLACNMKMNLDFINNELESISFIHFEEKGAGCQDRLKEALIAKYGMPKRTLPNENVEISESLAWRYNDTDINMTTIYYSPKARIFLHYSNSGVLLKWMLDQLNKDKL